MDTSDFSNGAQEVVRIWTASQITRHFEIADDYLAVLVAHVEVRVLRGHNCESVHSSPTVFAPINESLLLQTIEHRSQLLVCQTIRLAVHCEELAQAHQQ